MSAPVETALNTAHELATRQTSRRDRRELDRIDNEARLAIKELETRYSFLAELTQRSARQLRNEFEKYAEAQRKQALRDMPVEQLKEFSEKARPGPLRAAGLAMPALLKMSAQQLVEVPGVGPSTAASIEKAIAGARDWAAKMEVEFPRPDDLSRRQKKLLRAAALELRSASLPVGIVPELSLIHI